MNLSTETEVMIVGGGPVGVSLAIELGLHGVRSVIAERSDRVSAQPRAKLANIRTMELLRRWGLADEVRSAAPLPADYPSDITFVTRLNGWELARFPNALSTVRQPGAPSPEPAQQIPQPNLEAVLRQHLDPALVDLRLGWEVVGIEQDNRGVVTTLIDPAGKRRQVTSRFLAGCDGARSTVRSELSIEMEGSARLGLNLGIVFRSVSLSKINRHGRAVHYWCINHDVPSILGPLDGEHLWWMQLTALDNDVDVAALDLVGLVRAACGDDIDVEVLGSDPWAAHRLLATRHRVGRCFILGDAAHLHPPMGGYGMNMGIEDAVNLGWKVGAVHHGAPDALLDTYEYERRPIHERVLAESSSNYQLISNDLLVAEIEEVGTVGDAARARVGETILTRKAREFRSVGVQLGARYEGSPIVVADGTPEPPNPVDSYEPTSRPGHRLPHIWLDDDASTHDVVGGRFVLLTRDDDVATRSAFADASSNAGVPIDEAVLPPHVMGRLGAAALLVRPDLVVAWRCCEDGDRIDADEIVRIVTGRALLIDRETRKANA